MTYRCIKPACGDDCGGCSQAVPIIALLPCPFCGHPAVRCDTQRRHDFMPAIECSNGECGVMIVSLDDTMLDRKWNLRWTPPNDADSRARSASAGVQS